MQPLLVKWAFKCEAFLPFYLFTKRAKTEIFLYQSFPSLQRRWWVRIPRLWSNRTSQGGEVTRKSPLHLNNKVPNAPFCVPPSSDETFSHRRPPLPVTGSWLSPHRCITIRWENLGQLWDLLTWMNHRHYEQIQHQKNQLTILWSSPAPEEPDDRFGKRNQRWRRTRKRGRGERTWGNVDKDYVVLQRMRRMILTMAILWHCQC